MRVVCADVCVDDGCGGDGTRGAGLVSARDVAVSAGTGDAAAAVESFRANAASAVAAGDVTIEASPHIAATLVWDSESVAS